MILLEYFAGVGDGRIITDFSGIEDRRWLLLRRSRYKSMDYAAKRSPELLIYRINFFILISYI